MNIANYFTTDNSTIYTYKIDAHAEITFNTVTNLYHIWNGFSSTILARSTVIKIIESIEGAKL
jgi:hypothetical protein